MARTVRARLCLCLAWVICAIPWVAALPLPAQAREAVVAGYVHAPWISLGGAALSGAMSCLLYLAWRSFRRERRMRAQFNAEHLFLDAMDGIDASIIVFDKDLKTISWNRGFERAFPDTAAMICPGQSMARVLDDPDTFASDACFASAPGTAVTAQSVIERLRAGEDTTRLIHLKTGRVFEAREFMIGFRHYAAVRIDVTGMHRQADEIKKQQIELERVNDRLNIFSTVAAHDLRAPVQQVDSLLDFVMEDFGDARTDIPPEARANLDLIRRIMARMGNLVEDLLVYARTEGTTQTAERISPSERLREVAQLAAVPDSFEVEIARNMPDVHLPATEFDTVFRNLISNAVKHHDRGAGRIRIAGRRLGGKLIFDTEDDGPGIPPGSLEEIFEPFKRLNGSSDAAGSGLGLSFIRKSVEGWGGQVIALRKPGRGTVFRIILPDPDCATPPDIPPVRQGPALPSPPTRTAA